MFLLLKPHTMYTISSDQYFEFLVVFIFCAPFKIHKILCTSISLAFCLGSAFQHQEDVTQKNILPIQNYTVKM